MAEPPPRIVRVDVWELRQLYNTGDFEDRVAAGTLMALMKRESHCEPDQLPDNSPYCTHSQSFSLRDANDEEVARVHRYRRPDGSIAGSGINDPKRLVRDGIRYRLFKGPAEGED